MRRRPVRLTAVAAALRAIMEEDIAEAAEENNLVARDEAGDLHPFLFRIQNRMREEGGKGTRVRADALMERAYTDAMAIWNVVNPPQNERDHRWLALAEVAEIKKRDADLGDLSEQALARARADRDRPDDNPDVEQPGPGDDTIDLAPIRAYFEAVFEQDRSLADESLPEGGRIDAREGQPGRDTVPEGVREAFDFYYRFEADDFASVSLHQGVVAGVELYAVYTATDGDSAYLEVLDAEANTIDGARLFAEELIGWDEFPRRVRLSPEFVEYNGAESIDGPSEPEDRAANGSPPYDWSGDVKLEGALVYGQDNLLSRVEFPDITLSSAQREIAVAAIELLWDRVLKFNAPADGPVVLGGAQGGAGQLTVGNWTRINTGLRYEVADWRDIDDASYVLYFSRDAFGVYLALNQYDN
ncbi:MAG: hypothetical protein AAFV53_24510 [Myxococcota bacterium]